MAETMTGASRAAVQLCEAAGDNYVIVETVGVGQAEWQVHGMTDAFLLLAQPGAGDDLQGIKRGILELADVLAVQKADGDNVPRAQRARRELEGALSLLRPHDPVWDPVVLTCSALTGAGRDDDWDGRADFVIAIIDFEDDDGDGVPDAACAGAGGDCDDRDPGVFPGAAEACGNGRDDDCDGEVDEGCDAAPPEDFATDCGGGCSVPFDLGSAGALDGLTAVCGDVPRATFMDPGFAFGAACDGASVGDIVFQGSVWHTVPGGVCADRFSLSFDAAAGRVGRHSCNRDRLGLGHLGYVEEAGRRFLFLDVEGAPAVTVLEIVGGDVASAVAPCAMSVVVDGVCTTGAVSFPPFPGPSAVAAGLRGEWLGCNDGALPDDPTATDLAVLCDGAVDDFGSGAPARIMILTAGLRSEYDFALGATDTEPLADRCNQPARSAAGDRLQVWNAFDGVIAVESPRLRVVPGATRTYLLETPVQEERRAWVRVTLDPFTDPCASVALDFTVP